MKVWPFTVFTMNKVQVRDTVNYFRSRCDLCQKTSNMTKETSTNGNINEFEVHVIIPSMALGA